jgi:glyoxylate/hydroxypyruvate reductase A
MLQFCAPRQTGPEPLPPDNPPWRHPKVMVMPHVARRPTVAQLAGELGGNIRSLEPAADCCSRST